MAERLDAHRRGGVFSIAQGGTHFFKVQILAPAFGKLCYLAQNCREASTGEMGSIPVLFMRPLILVKHWAANLPCERNGSAAPPLIGAVKVRIFPWQCCVVALR